MPWARDEILSPSDYTDVSGSASRPQRGEARASHAARSSWLVSSRKEHGGFHEPIPPVRPVQSAALLREHGPGDRNPCSHLFGTFNVQLSTFNGRVGWTLDVERSTLNVWPKAIPRANARPELGAGSFPRTWERRFMAGEQVRTEHETFHEPEDASLDFERVVHFRFMAPTHVQIWRCSLPMNLPLPALSPTLSPLLRRGASRGEGETRLAALNTFTGGEGARRAGLRRGYGPAGG